MVSTSRKFTSPPNISIRGTAEKTRLNSRWLCLFVYLEFEKSDLPWLLKHPSFLNGRSHQLTVYLRDIKFLLPTCSPLHPLLPPLQKFPESRFNPDDFRSIMLFPAVHFPSISNTPRVLMWALGKSSYLLAWDPVGNAVLLKSKKWSTRHRLELWAGLACLVVFSSWH